MISSKAIELLSTFSVSEFQKFGLFLRSPYFNNEKVQVKFYVLLMKRYPLFDQKNFTKEMLYKKLYPGRKFNDGVMRNILSSTLELAQKFLIAERAIQMNENYFSQLLEELLNRRQLKLSEKAESGLEGVIEDEGIKDENYFHWKFVLEGLRRKSQLKQKSTLLYSDENLRSMAENLTNSYLINILRVNTFIINTNRNILKYNFDPLMLREVESLYNLNKEKFDNVTYLDYFFSSLKLAQTEDEQYFFRLKNILTNKFEELRDPDKSNIFSLLTNYCYIKINEGNSDFRRRNFELHREHIERGYFKGEKGYLSHIMYINVAVTGFDSGEFEWTEQFLDNYKRELDDTNRENTYNFCRALYYFHKKNYEKSLELAARVLTDDLSYKHQLKSLYLKVYFELNETEQFYSHIDSYRHFLSNQKNIPIETKEIVGAYVSFAKQIFDLKENRISDRYEMLRLKTEIISNKAMINKYWLLEKLTELEAK